MYNYMDGCSLINSKTSVQNDIYNIEPNFYMQSELHYVSRIGGLL